MLTEVLSLLPVLLTAMVMNTLTGVYQKIGIEKIGFDWKIFINGVIKLVIIFTCLLGCAYCCDQVTFLDLGEMAPTLIIEVGITGYVGKVAYNLFNIIKSHVSSPQLDTNEG